MSSNQARMATAVALALSSCVALGGTYQQDFQRGFYVGINSGASFVNGQTYSQLTKGREYDGPFAGTTTTFRDEASARGYNGGLSLGWNFYCDREYIYTVELSGNLYSNRAYQTWWSEGRSLDDDYDVVATRDDDEVSPGKLQNFEESWDMTYSADLTFRPGFFISDSTQLYGIMGASIAEIKTNLKDLTRRDRHHHDVRGGDNHRRDRNFDHEDKETVYGFVLGAGIQKQLCNRLSVFTSYQYTYYGHADLDNVVISGDRHDHVTARNENEENRRIDWVHNRKLRVDTNVFKLGLLYTF